MESKILKPCLFSVQSKNISTEIKWNFFSNARWFTQYEISSEENFGNKDALGFHIPGMWSKILDLQECFLQEAPSNDLRLAVRNYAIKMV